MDISLSHKPIAKKRPRFNTKTGRSYDDKDQKARSLFVKRVIESKIAGNALYLDPTLPLLLTLCLRIPMPQSWSTAKKKRFSGQPCTSRPDFDNYAKFYCDVMNATAFHDDAQITHAWIEKVWDFEGRVDISLTSLGTEMILEHGRTVGKDISTEDVEYLITKANKLGMAGRTIAGITETEDNEGRHIYLACSPMKERYHPEKGLC